MFLHAGAGAVVRQKEIIGIFDLDGKITTKDTADFLRAAEKAGIAELAGKDLPKSFLLSCPQKGKPGRTRVIFSHISAGVLAKRGEMLR